MRFPFLHAAYQLQNETLAYRFQSATMPAKTDFSAFNCSLARALAIVGDGWTLLILRDAFLGVTTFGAFQKSLGIAKNILSDRLDRLVDGGVLTRENTVRPAYKLTDIGWDVIPALVALMQWGDRWFVDGAPPMVLHGPDGTPVETLSLSAGARSVNARDVKARPGPGADPRTRAFLEWWEGR